MLKKVVKKPKGIASRIVDIEDAVMPVTMLAYGKAGTGKTVFGSTWPKPLLLIDVKEKGHESIRDVPGIKLLQIEKWEEINEVYMDVLWQKDTFKSVIVDQLTAAQALGMSHLREKKKMKQDDAFSQRGWGQLSGMMQQMIQDYRELYNDGYHVLFNAHERVREPSEEDDERLAPSVGSNLMQSVASFVNGAVSVIGNTFIQEQVDKKAKTREVQYCMRIGPHAYYAAKLRRPVSAGPTPDMVVNPTFDKIMRLTKGESLSKKVKRIK